MEFSADLIDHRLWLGNLDAAENFSALNDLGITHIVSIVEEIEFKEQPNIARLHIRLGDVETSDLLAIFDRCYEFIARALSENETNQVLIHCQAGVSRSATIACMWLMRRYRLSAKAAIEQVRRARPVIQPNPSFAAQLFLFELMDHQIDPEHPLHKEFQFERARAMYLDHDTELDSLEEKNRLRQQFCQAFTRPSAHAHCTVIERYRCRHCHSELFSNADLMKHSSGRGLLDWFHKHSDYTKQLSSTALECDASLFTYLPEWLIKQIDTPTNPHGDSIRCPQCSTVIGDYHLNGKKCSCGKWIVPGIHFDRNEIEIETITETKLD